MLSEPLHVPGPGWKRREILEREFAKVRRAAQRPGERRIVLFEAADVTKPELLAVDVEPVRRGHPAQTRRDEALGEDDKRGVVPDGGVSRHGLDNEPLKDL
jgi:hypothetical protein